ncbi:hypothetical protein CIB95_12915 [Lottiidibacillus patelloidae]|uniref:SnoaL-like domain-containing protein n=1 Tax=Lottiidibacillus patelloidae TaxID=2670334 RepID=A0A263BRH7_9BACI|nr:nuclear transport factor 2 family protein [Lottiidibacillus patelloidae]OZM56310.1 hypothetical protein CIB95_12915 [Lottiidibacillus patelloidae]
MDVDYVCALKKIYDSFSVLNFDAVTELLHEDIYWREAIGTDQEASILGLNEVKKHVLSQLPIFWERFDIIPIEFIQANEIVVVTTIYDIKEKLSQKRFSTGAAHIWKFKDNKAIELQTFINTVSEKINT